MATVNLPSRQPAHEVLLQLRLPNSSPILAVTIDGKKWTNFNARTGVINLRGLRGLVHVEAKLRN